MYGRTTLYSSVCSVTWLVLAVPHHILCGHSLLICESAPLSLGHLIGLIHQLEVFINLLAYCSLGFLSVLFARFHGQCLV